MAWYADDSYADTGHRVRNSFSIREALVQVNVWKQEREVIGLIRLYHKYEHRVQFACIQS